MSQSQTEKNKALVLEAFDTLFNQRDHARAERYWSPDYIQHSAHIEPGREGLFNQLTSRAVLRHSTEIFSKKRSTRKQYGFTLWTTRRSVCAAFSLTDPV
jgi:predicted SnoaL-like aldol condensation-catalyzing enzyme